MPAVASVDAPEPRELDARYFDTAAYDLATRGYALRRRTGGPDAGWHIKGPRGLEGGRVELGWPLGASDEGVPDAVLDVVDTVLAALDPSARELQPIARIRNHRTAYALRDAAGGLVAEFVDDRVTTTAVATGVERSWREWELELGPAAPADRRAFFTAAAAAAFAVGARSAASDSKLARALGQ